MISSHIIEGERSDCRHHKKYNNNNNNNIIIGINDNWSYINSDIQLTKEDNYKYINHEDDFDIYDLPNLGKNPNITLEIIEKNYNVNWNGNSIICNPNIIWEINNKNVIVPYELRHIPLVFFNILEYISYNPNISWKVIENNLNKKWSWKGLSQNLNITDEIIQKNIDKSWDWVKLSEHPNITWEIIENNLDKEWDWGILSKHPNITWKIIQDNPDQNWDRNNILINKNITWEIIQDNFEITDEDLKIILENPNISWEIIQTKFKIPWKNEFIKGILEGKLFNKIISEYKFKDIINKNYEKKFNIDYIINKLEEEEYDKIILEEEDNYLELKLSTTNYIRKIKYNYEK